MNRFHEKLEELTVERAEELLQVHSGTCEDPYDARMDAGFLECLKSWNGALNWQSFHQVMACIKTLGPSWSVDARIQRRAISDLWGIYYFGNDHVRDSNRRNHRLKIGISTQDLAVEELWLDAIGYAMVTYLQFDDIDEAFTVYNDLMMRLEK